MAGIGTAIRTASRSAKPGSNLGAARHQGNHRFRPEFNVLEFQGFHLLLNARYFAILICRIKSGCISPVRNLDSKPGPDMPPNNDDGYVKLIGTSVPRPHSRANIARARASTGWTGFGAIVDPGTYTLQFEVENIGDNQLSSQVLADNINVSAVPEASTWAMVLVGFAGLGLMARRRKAGATLLEA